MIFPFISTSPVAIEKSTKVVENDNGNFGVERDFSSLSNGELNSLKTVNSATSSEKALSTIFDNFVNSWQTSATQLQKDYIKEMKDYNEKQAELAFQRSQTSADKQMDFQREMFDKQTAYNTLMSNTQYQRAVADLKKAGINPILAVGGLSGSVPSASVGSGASTQASAPTMGQANFANSLSVDRNLGSALSGMLTSAGKLIKAFL